MIYDALNSSVAQAIPSTATQILDVGCGTGSLGKYLKQVTPCSVTGITYSPDEGAIARQVLDQVWIDDLNHFDFDQLNHYDCIVCSHILEHVYQPHEILKHLRSHLKPEGTLIVALPNVLHWKQRLEFLRGHFKYTDAGLMDRTHIRFFDWETALELVESSGFQVKTRQAEGNFPLPMIRRWIPPIASKIDAIATTISPGLFGFQFILVAHRR